MMPQQQQQQPQQMHPQMQQQHQQMHPQQQQQLAAQMGGMNLDAGGAPNAGEMQPAKTKRSARAYHQQDEPVQQGYGQQPGPQAAWQNEAAARVAGYESQMAGQADAALDQMPGQRNVLSPAQAAANQQRMAAEGQRGQLHAPGAPGGAFAQSMPLTPGPPGPHTPGLGPNPNFAQGISQPPHQAGQRFPGPRSKIDPDQIPSPVEAQDADQEFFDREWFATCGRGGLPLSTTDFGAIDQGALGCAHPARPAAHPSLRRQLLAEAHAAHDVQPAGHGRARQHVAAAHRAHRAAVRAAAPG
jgi:protein transport protein SEC24